MKASTEFVELLREAIVPLDTPERRVAFGGLTDMRYRWDLLWACPRQHEILRMASHEGLADVHITTALASVVPGLIENEGAAA